MSTRRLGCVLCLCPLQKRHRCHPAVRSGVLKYLSLSSCVVAIGNFLGVDRLRGDCGPLSPGIERHVDPAVGVGDDQRDGSSTQPYRTVRYALTGIVVSHRRFAVSRVRWSTASTSGRTSWVRFAILRSFYFDVATATPTARWTITDPIGVFGYLFAG